MCEETHVQANYLCVCTHKTSMYMCGGAGTRGWITHSISAIYRLHNLLQHLPQTSLSF